MDKLEQAREARHPLEAYADSYAQMARMGNGKVDCRSVEVDIRQNMIPATQPLAALSLPVEGVKGEPVAWRYRIPVYERSSWEPWRLTDNERLAREYSHRDGQVEPLFLANPEAEARLRERVEPTWRAGQYANPLDKSAFKWLIFCDAWQTSIASGLTKEAAEEIARAHNDALAEAAEARLVQAERVPAVTEADLKRAYLKGRREWIPAGILKDEERTERDWQEAKAALQQSAAGEEGKP